MIYNVHASEFIRGLGYNKVGISLVDHTPGFRVAEEFNNCIRHMASYELQRWNKNHSFQLMPCLASQQKKSMQLPLYWR